MKIVDQNGTDWKLSGEISNEGDVLFLASGQHHHAVCQPGIRYRVHRGSRFTDTRWALDNYAASCCFQGNDKPCVLHRLYEGVLRDTRQDEHILQLKDTSHRVFSLLPLLSQKVPCLLWQPALPVLRNLGDQEAASLPHMLG